MEYFYILVWLGLIYSDRCSAAAAGLLEGESQDQIFRRPPAASSSSPIPSSLLVGQPPSSINRDSNDDVSSVEGARVRPYFPPKSNVIRKSFSLETTTAETTPHFEALTNRNGTPGRVSYINNKRSEDDNIVDRFNALKRGQTLTYVSPSYSSRPTYAVPLSNERRVGTSVSSTLGQPPGPSLQQIPLRRQWSTERNTVSDDDLGASLGSFSYATPTPSPSPSSYRGNVRYTSPTESTFGTEYEPRRGGKNLPNPYYNQNRRREYVEPTTYRPLFKPVSTTGQYSFSFRTVNNSRDEIGNSDGHFRGSVKFRDTQGRDKRVEYVANPGRGLVLNEVPVVSVDGRSGYVPSFTSTLGPLSSIEGELSPSTPGPFPRNRRPPFPSSTPYPPIYSSTPYPFSPSEGSYSYSSPTPAYDNELRYGKGFPSTVAPVLIASSLPTPDGAYAFSYDAGDHERKEVRDSAGNVRGMYSFMTPEGERKLVEYAADAQNGFMAQGEHLPVQESRQISQGSPQEPAGGSYYFSYDAGDHSRQEVRDSNGNVEGSFSFLTADGLKQIVHYQANPEDGFRIKSSRILNSGEYK